VRDDVIASLDSADVCVLYAQKNAICLLVVTSTNGVFLFAHKSHTLLHR